MHLSRFITLLFTSILFGHDLGLETLLVSLLNLLFCDFLSKGSVFGLFIIFLVWRSGVCLNVLSLCSEMAIFTLRKSKFLLGGVRLRGVFDSWRSFGS
jgi:hypothetical protein